MPCQMDERLEVCLRIDRPWSDSRLQGDIWTLGRKCSIDAKLTKAIVKQNAGVGEVRTASFRAEHDRI